MADFLLPRPLSLFGPYTPPSDVGMSTCSTILAQLPNVYDELLILRTAIDGAQVRVLLAEPGLCLPTFVAHYLCA